MALDATLGNEISPEMMAALQPRRNFAPEMDRRAPIPTPEPHLYEKHGLAPGKVNTDYSQKTAKRNAGSNNIDSAPTIIHRNANPPHINTTAPIYNKPGYTAGITTALLARYALEAIAQNRFSPVKSEKARSNIATHAKREAQKHIDALQEAYDVAFNNLSPHDRSELGAFKNDTLKHIQEGAEEHVKISRNSAPAWFKEGYDTPRMQFRRFTELAQEKFWDLLGQSDKKSQTGARGLYNRVEKVFGAVGGKDVRDEASNALEDSIRHFMNEAKNPEIGTEGARLSVRTAARTNIKNHVKDGIKKSYEGRFYDTMLGAYSLTLTTFYASKVYRDMRSLFDEAVAYELDKDPRDVTLGDVWNSKNGVVKETWKNWGSRNALRYATDLIFFGRHAKLDINFGHFGLASKAGLIIKDIMGRRLTTFEKLTSFVDGVIKPEDGLGTSITSESLVDLFQSYTVHNRPDVSFQSVVGNNASEEVRWDYARQIFDRMAELMNQSYSYKHAVRYDENFQPLAQKSFTLPAFIFMLGNDMIDPNNPNFTMARIEIASEYGVQAMKQAHKEFTAAQHLPEAEQLPIFNKVMAQFPEAHVQWQSRAERLETAKSRKSAKELAPLRPEETERPAIENVALENAHHAKLETPQLNVSI